MTLQDVLDGMAPEDAERVVPDADGGYLVGLRSASWLVGMRLEREAEGQRGAWRTTSLVVQASTGEGSITSVTVRNLPLGDLLNRARAAVAGPARKASGRRLLRPSEVRLASWLQDARRTGKRSDHDYAQLAEEYALRVEQGDRYPAASLARQYGASAAVWTNRVMEARKRGLLTAAQRGRPGGHLTDKAMDVLGYHPEDKEE